MKIFNIELDFLWLKREHIILDGPDPFREKWRTEKLKLIEFIEKDSFTNIVELVVSVYKDNYPRRFLIGGLINMEPLKDLYKEEDYQVIETKYLTRNDLEKYKFIEKKDDHGSTFLYKLELEFANIVDLEETIDNTLKSKTFSKNIDGNKTIYSVEDSPLAKIEITANSFGFTINEDHYVYLRPF